MTTLAGRLGSLRVAENDLPGGLDTRTWTLVAGPGARDPLRRRCRPPHGSSAAIARSGSLGGVAQVISVAQIHGNYAAYAWAFPSRAAARAALRAARSQPGMRVTRAPVVPGAVRVVRPGKRLLDDLFWSGV